MQKQRQGKKVFLPLLCNTYFTLFLPCLKTQHNPYPHMPCHHDEEKRGESCPVSDSRPTAQTQPIPSHALPP